MTKEEAIEMLKHCAVEYYCKDHYWGRHMCEKCNQRIAQDMAIESLKTEAIPVEWIEQYGKANWYDFGTKHNAITEMLGEWKRKEE